MKHRCHMFDFPFVLAIYLCPYLNALCCLSSRNLCFNCVMQSPKGLGNLGRARGFGQLCTRAATVALVKLVMLWHALEQI